MAINTSRPVVVDRIVEALLDAKATGATSRSGRVPSTQLMAACERVPAQ